MILFTSNNSIQNILDNSSIVNKGTINIQSAIDAINTLFKGCYIYYVSEYNGFTDLLCFYIIQVDKNDNITDSNMITFETFDNNQKCRLFTANEPLEGLFPKNDGYDFKRVDKDIHLLSNGGYLFSFKKV